MSGHRGSSRSVRASSCAAVFESSVTNTSTSRPVSLALSRLTTPPSSDHRARPRRMMVSASAAEDMPDCSRTSRHRHRPDASSGRMTALAPRRRPPSAMKRTISSCVHPASDMLTSALTLSRESTMPPPGEPGAASPVPTCGGVDAESDGVGPDPDDDRTRAKGLRPRLVLVLRRRRDACSGCGCTFVRPSHSSSVPRGLISRSAGRCSRSVRGRGAARSAGTTPSMDAASPSSRRSPMPTM